MANAVAMSGVSRVHRLPSAAGSTNATVVSVTPTRIYHMNCHNAAAGVRYIKLYNKATTPAETDTPLITIALVASVPREINFLTPIEFTTGLAYRMVTGAADNDTNAVTAADILGFNIVYA